MILELISPAHGCQADGGRRHAWVLYDRVLPEPRPVEIDPAAPGAGLKIRVCLLCCFILCFRARTVGLPDYAAKTRR